MCFVLLYRESGSWAGLLSKMSKVKECISLYSNCKGQNVTMDDICQANITCMWVFLPRFFPEVWLDSSLWVSLYRSERVSSKSCYLVIFIPNPRRRQRQLSVTSGKLLLQFQRLEEVIVMEGKLNVQLMQWQPCWGCIFVLYMYKYTSDTKLNNCFCLWYYVEHPSVFIYGSSMI